MSASDPPADHRLPGAGTPPFASLGDHPPRRLGLLDFLMAPFRDIDERAHYAPGSRRRAGNGKAGNGHAADAPAGNGHAGDGRAGRAPPARRRR